MFDEWVGEASVLGFEILPQLSERLCTQNLDGALQTDGAECTLSVGREVKMEIPVSVFDWSGLLSVADHLIDRHERGRVQNGEKPLCIRPQMPIKSL